MIKKLFFLLIAFIATINTNAQTIYNTQNCYQRIALLSYAKNDNGTYTEITSKKSIDKTIHALYAYAYDEKTHHLYVVTSDANMQITLFDNKETKKKMKNSEVPKLNGDALQNAINEQSKILKEKYQGINKHIQDSIAHIKYVQDSIVAAQDSIAAVQAFLDSIYFNKHKDSWQLHVPNNVTSLYCVDCCKDIELEGEYIYGRISQDNMFIYYLKFDKGLFGIRRVYVHKLKISSKLNNYDEFQRHIRVFADSIKSDTLRHDDFMESLNGHQVELYSDEMQKIAPFGFVDNYSWGLSYGNNISFRFAYTNTNKKTIKYIKPYFKVTNDVNDVRGTGYFSGTGPLEQYDTATWAWDNSVYYVAGDASHMSITKIVITYMDNTIKVLNQNNIMFK